MIELMIKLEGLELQAYDCEANKRTIGYGFNMERAGAKKTWKKLNIVEDFDKVFNKEIEISKDSAKILYEYIWDICVKTAKKRCKRLNLVYDDMPEFQKFILPDIVYNVGNIKKWTKVLTETKAEEIIYEARRNPKKMMDSRVSKIAYHFGLIKNLDEAKEIGLEFAEYLE